MTMMHFMRRTALMHAYLTSPERVLQVLVLCVGVLHHAQLFAWRRKDENEEKGDGTKTRQSQ
jgi:hypothetical protein